MAFGIIHGHPARGLALRNFDRLFDEFTRDFGTARPVRRANPVRRIQTHFTPRFEAVETEGGYEVTAELPGVEAQDLEVTVEDGVLTVKGERVYGVEAAAAVTETDADREAEAGVPRRAFERRLRFPGEIVETEVKASYKNGVLTVKVPKPEVVTPEVRSIPVETV